jgi:hypothetical protein
MVTRAPIRISPSAARSPGQLANTFEVDERRRPHVTVAKPDDDVRTAREQPGIRAVPAEQAVQFSERVGGVIGGGPH